MLVDPWTVLALVYVSGVVLGSILGDGPVFARVGLGLLWPLGPLAFAVTIAILLGASLIAFPATAGTALVLGIVVWWLL